MGATTVACTSCRKALSGEEGRKVADWTFCASCFAALLEKPKALAPKPAPAAAPASPSPSVPLPRRLPEAPGCSLCEGPLAAGEGIAAGTLRVCASCASMLRSLAREVEEAPASAPAEALPAAPDHAPVSWAWTECAGCGRRIQERASKLHDGRPHCPECFHALPVAPTPAPAAVPAPSPSGDGCDACGRPLVPAGVAHVQGFQLCLACRATDEALALDLARAHHRRRLLALKAQLPG